MPLIIALLKINISLALCYSLYYFLLRKLTFYNLNRIFFLCAIALSAAMPFIHIELERPPVQTLDIRSMEVVYTASDPVRGTFSIADGLSFIFWTGVFIMGMRMLIQLLSVGMLYLRSRKTRFDDTPIRILQTSANPCSFFKCIFIYPGVLPQDELKMVIRHEKVHVRQWHSIDILLAEANKAFCWFNPAAWLMLQAIKQNLEFIADREVLGSGTETRAYQYSLLRVSQSGQHPALTNNFNFSHLKTRIIMMNKRQSGAIHLMKYFAAVPLAAVLVCYFGVSMAQQKKVVIKEAPQVQSQKSKETQITVTLQLRTKRLRLLLLPEKLKVSVSSERRLRLILQKSGGLQ